MTIVLATLPTVLLCGVWLSWSPPAAGAAALALPFAAVQDNARYQAFATRRPGVAAVSDVVTLAPVALMLALSGHAVRSSSAALLALAAGACAGAAVAMVQLRTPLRVGGLRSFASVTRGSRRAGLLEFGSNALVTQVPLLVMPLTAPFADLAGIRGLQLSFAPVTVVHSAAFALIMPRLGDAFVSTGVLRTGLLRVYVVGLCAVTAVLATLVQILPSSVLTTAFGDTADAVRPQCGRSRWSRSSRSQRGRWRWRCVRRTPTATSRGRDSGLPQQPFRLFSFSPAGMASSARARG
jgi:hypothetical protein